MTNAIEKTRREMYLRFGMIKDLTEDNTAPSLMMIGEFENSMEEHLEALRQERCAIAQDRDTLRNKLQAFEFANRSAAELLSEALREPSGLRKSAGSMVHQNRKEELPCSTCGGSTTVWMISDKVDFPYRGNCPSCTPQVVL